MSVIDENSFDLEFPKQDGGSSKLVLNAGEVLFVLGANGTGKSSLMQHFAKNNSSKNRKISAHRQTWIESDTLDMTSKNKRQTERSVQQSDQKQQSRYRDDYAAVRASITLYEIIDAQNVRAREIAEFVDSNEIVAAKNAAKNKSPIKVINDLLKQSNIPVEISIRENERLVAKKSGSVEYGAAELSDGERNALLIAGNVLTAKSGTLLIIDEPERHLHRSIISPLLEQLFSDRSDCGFVISTHDHDLPLQIPNARILLLRSCEFNGQIVNGWDADKISVGTSIDDSLKRDLIGARRTILFVEGTEASLDKLLYSIVFPKASIIPKGSCNEVERAVEGARGAEDYHWLRVFGIVDGDGYSPEQIKVKEKKGIYVLPVYSVEAIYYHTDILQQIALKQADSLGEDESAMFDAAIRAGVDAIKNDVSRLSGKAVKKLVRKSIIDQIPNDDKLMSGQPISINNDAKSIEAQRINELNQAINSHEWGTILTMCSVRESRATNDIAKTLHYQSTSDYEKAVRQLLKSDENLLKDLRGLFGDLIIQLNA